MRLRTGDIVRYVGCNSKCQYRDMHGEVGGEALDKLGKMFKVTSTLFGQCGVTEIPDKGLELFHDNDEFGDAWINVAIYSGHLAKVEEIVDGTRQS